MLLHMTLMLTATRYVDDQYDFFAAIANNIAACLDRVEEVIGRGNFKWVLITLLVLLALWYARRRH